MIKWVISLPEVSDEAFAELLQTPGQHVPHGDQVIWEWGQNHGWLDAHAVTQLELALEAGYSLSQMA